MPTALKVLRGEKRESRLNRQAPRPVGTGPVMPPGMSAGAQRVWRRQVASLGPTGILTPVDSYALRCFCEAVDRYTVSAQLLAGSAPVIRGPNGLAKNPLHQIVRDNAMLVRMYAIGLGFMPSAREGLRVAIEAEADPLASWLGAAR